LAGEFTRLDIGHMISVDGFSNLIAKLLNAFPPAECADNFRLPAMRHSLWKLL
jgi:hypothetical protein